MRRCLYTGLDVPKHLKGPDVIHKPTIRILPRPFKDVSNIFFNIDQYTHIIFTSKTAVVIFMDHINLSKTSKEKLKRKHCIAVGKMTAQKMTEHGLEGHSLAENETAEGIIAVLATLDLQQAHVLWPHSALSRPLISDWLTEKNIAHTHLALYDTVTNKINPLPEITAFDEIIFTSPSTIDGFIENYGFLPKDKVLTCIGPITQAYLDTRNT